jgi:hypothetical protein
MRTIVLEIRVRMLREIPDDMDDEAARFHFEENHCLSNEIEELHRSNRGENHCNICHRADAEILRDATPEDLERLKLYLSHPEDGTLTAPGSGCMLGTLVQGA